MVRRVAGSALFLLCAFAVAAPADAADLTSPPPAPVFIAPAPAVVSSPFGILSEVRIGASDHGVPKREAGTVDVNGEVLTVKPYTFGNAWDYLVPRFHVGGDLNIAGKTSQVYAGVTWQVPIFGRFFGEATFGGEYNDGHTGLVVPAGYAAVGSNVMFRESGSIGYHLTEHWNIMATIEHSSNANLARRNQGITNIGGRLGYVF